MTAKLVGALTMVAMLGLMTVTMASADAPYREANGPEYGASEPAGGTRLVRHGPTDPRNGIQTSWCATNAERS